MIQFNYEMFYTVNTNVSLKLNGDKEAALYHPDIKQEKLLNHTGLFIWRRLDGTRSIKEIAANVCDFFASAPYDQVLSDASGFLEDLSRQGFVSKHKSRLPHPKRMKEYKKCSDINDAPQSIDISLTGRCNLQCPYCFYANEMKYRQDLPLEQWLGFFEELGRLAVREVCLSGGEVFTRSDIWDIIDGVIANRMRYSILTNGTLITRNTLASFEKGKRRTRLSSIQISIDGSCPEIHDRCRGRGSFKRAVRGLRLLKEAGFPVTSRVTVNRYNVDDLENTARLLIDEIGLHSFGTNDAMPMGAGGDNRGAIALLPKQQLKAMETLSRLVERYKGRITAMAGPLTNWQRYKEMEHAKATGEKPTGWQMGYLTACGCMFNKLAVHHDGVITPCNMLSKLKLGRIIIDSLKEIWKSHPTLKVLKERRQIPMNQVSGCRDCEWVAYCNGGCPGLAYEMTGDFNRANPHDCYRSFLVNADTEYKTRLKNDINKRFVS